MEYLILNTLFFIGIYIVLSVSLDLLLGQAGILSVAHAAFYGLGAYTSALLTVNLGVPFLIAILVGIVVASSLSFVISLLSLRLHDDYFVIATFAFQIILFSVFNNWVSLTGGSLGIQNIPSPSILGLRIESRYGFVALSFGLAAFAYVVVRRVSISPFGRVLRAIREDEIFAESLGKNTLRFKVLTFAVSAALAASAGSLYAHYSVNIDSTSFTLLESILIISMVIIGGAGSIWGPAVGAMLLVIFPEVLRYLGLPNSVAANWRQILYGVLLIVMMLTRPRGLFGRFNLGRRSN
jgi:branched-chain amino acid transport system permease protein